MDTFNNCSPHNIVLIHFNYREEDNLRLPAFNVPNNCFKYTLNLGQPLYSQGPKYCFPIVRIHIEPPTRGQPLYSHGPKYCFPIVRIHIEPPTRALKVRSYNYHDYSILATKYY